MPPKVVPGLTPHLVAHYVVKFHEATPLSAKVLVPYMLHFKPILDPPL